MGRVFIEEAMITTGIDRTNLVTVCTHLVRTKQAKSAADAIRKLEVLDTVDTFDGLYFDKQTQTMFIG